MRHAEKGYAEAMGKHSSLGTLDKKRGPAFYTCLTFCCFQWKRKTCSEVMFASLRQPSVSPLTSGNNVTYGMTSDLHTLPVRKKQPELRLSTQPSNLRQRSIFISKATCLDALPVPALLSAQLSDSLNSLCLLIKKEVPTTTNLKEGKRWKKTMPRLLRSL